MTIEQQRRYIVGDRVNVEMRFGSKISAEALDDLVLELDSQGFLRAFEHLTPQSVKDIPVADKLAALAGWVDADEVNYANTDSIDGTCMRHKIDFDKQHGAGGGYGAEVIRMRDGVLIQYPADDENEATIPLSRVLQVETLATGLADLIAEAKAWARPLAKLELVP